MMVPPHRRLGKSANGVSKNPGVSFHQQAVLQ
jgi:hypothetical protein